MLKLRPVNDSDCRLLWEWVNDPTVREQSFSSGPIPWDEHVAWFAGKRQDKNCHHFIVLNAEGEAVAQVRFDIDEEAEVGVSVDTRYRGRGYGAKALKLASRGLLSSFSITRISAYIKPDNTASIKAFSNSGYKSLGKTIVKEQPAVHMVLEQQGENVREELVGSLFSLIPFKEEHISDRYIGWLNDPEVNRFLEIRYVRQTYDTVLEYVRSFSDSSEKFMWGIYPEGSKDLIGTATLYIIYRQHGMCGIGLMIGDRNFWGGAASTGAIELMAEYAFETLGLRRMHAETYASNLGMNFTFKRMGFALEGRLKKAYSFSPGNYTDAYQWGLLAEDWRARDQRGS